MLDGAALRRNADTIQGWAAAHGMELMPHGKTTMAPAPGGRSSTPARPGSPSPRLARCARRARSASRPSCLANAPRRARRPRVRRGRVRRSGVRIRVRWVDLLDTVEAMERGLASSGIALPWPIDVLVELGAPRAAERARSLDAAEAVARRVVASPALRLAGVAGYEGSLGHDRSAKALGAVRDYSADPCRACTGSCSASSARTLIVSVGGSAYLDLVAEAFGPAIEADAATGRRTR